MNLVRKAYKRRALEVHPDKLKSTATYEEKQAAEARFHEVQDAFEVLNDVIKRRAYDVQTGVREDPAKRWAHLNAQHAARMKDREEWAKQAEERHQERMRLHKEHTTKAQEAITQKNAAALKYSQMVDNMVNRLRDLNPEWEARKLEAQQRQQAKRPGAPTRAETV